MSIKRLSTQLQAWRERHKLTQIEAAQRLEVPVNTLRNWEQDRTTPRGPALRMILALIAD